MADPTELDEIPRPGLRQRLAEALIGDRGAILPSDQLELVEAEIAEGRVMRKDLELLAWTALDYMGGNEQDMKAVNRRKLVQQARVAWKQDPQIGASTELMNDFALGRGVPAPKARDPKVQEILDEAWDDEDNKLVLTTYEAQLRMNTDLTLQCNLFFLVFDSGQDGVVKISMLDHDTVESVVRDDDNRRKILYYVARQKRMKTTLTPEGPKVTMAGAGDTRPKVLYYAHWEHEAPSDLRPAPELIGDGKVYHVAINATGEMGFGHPQIHRLLRWATAFNNFMESRVDMAKAAASLVMKRKVKGSKNQVQKTAQAILSRRSPLGGAVDSMDEPAIPGPRDASVVNENEGVEHEKFNLDSGAGGATQDAQMLRSQVVAGSSGRWPQHYLGDVGSSNLATASAMELVPLKAVESRQEIIEQIFRWFCDLVIKRAIDSGRLTEELTAKEKRERKENQEREETDQNQPEPTTESDAAPALTEAPVDGDLLELNDPGRTADDEEVDDDKDNMRDLSYDFGLPSPVRRMLGDLVTAVQEIATTFDPNGTNVELSRTLLAVVLGEGLEMADPGEIIEKVFPPGYKDPALAALAGLKGRGGAEPGAGAAAAAQEDNPYGAVQNGTLGGPNPYGSLQEAMFKRLTPETRKRLEQHKRDQDDLYALAAREVEALVPQDA